MKLFFRKYGDGPPLIILHGLYGSSDNWVTIAKKISSRFTVYLPDLRNHGNSPHSDVSDYDSMCDDIIDFAKEQKMDSFFLAGHSMGGRVAMSVAIKKPGIILGLIVADISPFDNGILTEKAVNEHSDILKTVLSTNLKVASRREDIDSQLAKGIASAEIRALIMKNLRRNIDGSFGWKFNAVALKESVNKITSGIPFDIIRDEQVAGFPVVFLKGECSGYITNEGFNDILKIFPGAELKIIKNAGHWLQADNPDAVIKAFGDLLNN